MPESDFDPTADDNIPDLSPEQEAQVSTLLAHLRDEKPNIPAEIAARIEAALAAEHLARAASDTQSPGADPIASESDASNIAPITPLAAARTSTRMPRSKTLFATAASVAALALLIGRPWVHETGGVVATGPTTSASNTTEQQRGVNVTPRETLMQVSRHSYHRSSLAEDAAAFITEQSQGTTVRASAAPKEWKGVTQCVKRTLSVLGTSLASKVDLGWLDGRPSAIVVISDTAGSDPAPQVRVLQDVNGRCTIAASASLAR